MEKIKKMLMCLMIMSKLKILLGILIVFALFICVNLLINKSNFINQKETHSLTTKSLKNFTEGVWIKKYPSNSACFKFETPKGIKIICDPYMMDETVDPDIVTESHQHGDHTDVSKLKGSYKLITSIGEFNEKGIKIIGYNGKHNKGETMMIGNALSVVGPNNIYIFEIDGIKIAHFASQGELPSEDLLKKIKYVDVLLIQASILPEYVDSKLTLKECNSIIKTLHPKIVIPEHGTPTLGEALAKYLNLKIEYASDGNIIVTRSELDQSKTLRIMKLDTGPLEY